MPFSSKQIQHVIGNVLLSGTLISSFIVLVGGILFLMTNGLHPLTTHLFDGEPQTVSNSAVWHFAFSFSPLGIIQLGLLFLVFTQFIRVGLLCWYYFSIKDYYFTVFSLFIFIVLLYSLFWRVV